MLLSAIICVFFMSFTKADAQAHRSTAIEDDYFIFQKVLMADKTLCTFIQNWKNILAFLSKQRLLQLVDDENFPNFKRGGVNDLKEKDKIYYENVKRLFTSIKDMYSEIESVHMRTEWGGGMFSHGIMIFHI